MSEEQLWNGSHHIFLKEPSKYMYKLKELFQKRNNWPLEYYYRDPTLTLCCSPSMVPTCSRCPPPPTPHHTHTHTHKHTRRHPPSPTPTTTSLGLCQWPSSLPVIQTHSFHESKIPSHRHWKLCGRTEELDDFQHDNCEWQEDKILVVHVGSKQQLGRVNIPFIHAGKDRITPLTSARNLGVIFDSNLKMDMQITRACQKRLLSSPQHQENPKISEQRSHVHDYTCIYYKPNWPLQQFDEWATSESHQETPACYKTQLPD